MRLKRLDTRLLVVDEPTSALDAVAEHEMTSRLLERRKGKTMIFVTHRFGSLVKHADLILSVDFFYVSENRYFTNLEPRCVKEGKIVEQGTHDRLLNQANGEYAKMYTKQAAGYE
jgi:ABC-type multidrug transport system fused ATPase/permease subunit